MKFGVLHTRNTSYRSWLLIFIVLEAVRAYDVSDAQYCSRIAPTKGNEEWGCSPVNKYTDSSYQVSDLGRTLRFSWPFSLKFINDKHFKSMSAKLFSNNGAVSIDLSNL
jgi:hypothetical protein